MTTTRWGHVGWQSPSHTVPNNYFLTAMGGRYDTVVTSSNSIMTNYEISRIVVVPDPPYSLIREKQTVQTFILSNTNPLPTSKNLIVLKFFVML